MGPTFSDGIIGMAAEGATAGPYVDPVVESDKKRSAFFTFKDIRTEMR